MRARIVLTLTAAVLWSGGTAAGARGDGLPVLGYVGARVLVGHDGTRYRTRLDRRQTIVTMRSATGGRRAEATLPGHYELPIVALDGSAGGLTADGRTLVVASVRRGFPQRSSSLAILSGPTLALRRVIRLPGDFSFDAISPDGRWLYLIQYSSGSVSPRYRVRAMDTRTGALMARPIVDPNDRGEAMQGSPITRVSSPDGRWDYTLYAGNTRAFIHALDTTGLRARCIDLPTVGVAGIDPASTRLRLSGDRLAVVLDGWATAGIDTRSLTLRDATSRRGTARSGDGGELGIGLAVFALVVAALAATARRQITVPAGR